MVDEPDPPLVFRNRFEEAALQINTMLEAQSRFGHSRSFDYSDPDKMVFTGFESPRGRPMVFTLTPNRRSVSFVDRELPKAIDAFDRAG